MFAGSRKISSSCAGALSWAHPTGGATATALCPPRGWAQGHTREIPALLGVRQAQNKAKAFPRHHLIVFVSAGCIHHLPAATRSSCLHVTLHRQAPAAALSNSQPGTPSCCLLLPRSADCSGCCALLQPTAGWDSPNLCSLRYPSRDWPKPHAACQVVLAVPSAPRLLWAPVHSSSSPPEED